MLAWTSLLLLLVLGLGRARAAPSAVFRRAMSSPPDHPHVSFDVVHHHKVTPVGIAQVHGDDYPHAALASSGAMCEKGQREDEDVTSVTLFFASQENASAWTEMAGAEPTLVGFCVVRDSHGSQRPVRMRGVTVVSAGASKIARGYFELKLVGHVASVNDVFLHANVTATLQPGTGAEFSPEPTRRRLDGCDATSIAAGKCTENFRGQTVRLPGSVNWNVGSKSLSYGSVSVTGKGLKLRISPTLYFELGITLSKINKFSIAVQGSLEASAGFGFKASSSATSSKTYNLAKVNIPIVSFSIGAFPFVVAPSIPISAGTFFSANANAELFTSASYRGSISAGVKLSGSSLRPSYSINFPSPSSPKPDMKSSATAQVTAKAWLAAALEFNVQGLAQLGVKVKQTISGMAKISTSGPLSASLGGEFGVNVYGSLGAKLAGINIPPSVRSAEKTVYSKSFSLYRK